MLQNNLSWEKIQVELKSLKKKIDYKPDVVIGIVRGGIIPARLLSTYLGVKEMFCLTVKKVGDQRKIMTTINDDIKGKNILLVEDILETGKSLIVAKQYLEEKGASVKTLCLYVLPKAEITPDYFVKNIDQIVTLPWE